MKQEMFVDEEIVDDDDIILYTNIDCYPLHLAIVFHPSDDVIIQLIDIFPKSISIKTKKDGYALHIACCQRRSVTIIQKLIELYPIALQ